MPTKRQVEAYHRKLCRQLGIEPATVIMCSDEELEYHMGAYNSKKRLLKAARHNWMKGLSGVWYDWRWVVRHETYHHNQACKGWLTPTHYRGTVKRYWRRRGPWSKWPWERAANRFADKVTT